MNTRSVGLLLLLLMAHASVCAMAAQDSLVCDYVRRGQKFLAERREEQERFVALKERIQSDHFLTAGMTTEPVRTFVARASFVDLRFCAELIFLQHEVMEQIEKMSRHLQITAATTDGATSSEISVAACASMARRLRHDVPRRENAFYHEGQKQLVNSLLASYDRIVSLFPLSYRAYLYPGFALINARAHDNDIAEKMLKQTAAGESIDNTSGYAVKKYELIAWYRLHRKSIVQFYNALSEELQKQSRAMYEELMHESSGPTRKKSGKHKKHAAASANASAQITESCAHLEEADEESFATQVAREGLDDEDIEMESVESLPEGGSVTSTARLPSVAAPGFPARIEYARRVWLWHVDIQQALKKHGDLGSKFWAVVKHRIPLILEREYGCFARQGMHKKTATCADRMFYFDGWIEVFGGSLRIPGTFELALGPDGQFYHRFFRVDREHVARLLPDVPTDDANEVRFSRARVRTTYLVNETDRYVCIVEKDDPYGVRYVICKSPNCEKRLS